MTRTQAYLVALGSALVILGIVLGSAIGVSTSGTSGEQSCGKAWSGKNPIVGANFSGRKNLTDYAAECSDARQTRGTFAFIVIGLGAASLGAAFVAGKKDSHVDA
jgi:hypothetical protein